MSWMPPELAVNPEDKKYECYHCGSMKWAEEFTDSDYDYYEMICNDCYKEIEEDRWLIIKEGFMSWPLFI